MASNHLKKLAWLISKLKGSLLQERAATAFSAALLSARSIANQTVSDRGMPSFSPPASYHYFCTFQVLLLSHGCAEGKGCEDEATNLSCLAKEPEKVLVVGVCGKPRLGAVQGNAFGNAFRSAAEEIGTDYFHDMFELSWIVLDVADLLLSVLS